LETNWIGELAAQLMIALGHLTQFTVNIYDALVGPFLSFHVLDVA